MTKEKHTTLSALISDLISKVREYDKITTYSDKADKYNEVGKARWAIHEFMDNLK